MNKFIPPKQRESTEGSFWWLSPEGKFYPVPSQSHGDWARNYLIKDVGLSLEEVDGWKNLKNLTSRERVYESPYYVLINMGWMRVGTYQDWIDDEYIEKVIEYDNKKGNIPSTFLVRKIKDLAIKKGIKWIRSDQSKKIDKIYENYNKSLSDDEKYDLANSYFSVGQDDDETIYKNYCWIWNKADGSVKAKKGGTHSTNFGHMAKEYTYSGWYDVDKNMISIVFPECELKKIGDKKPTENDIPEQIYQSLIRKFGKRKPKFMVFETIKKSKLKRLIKEIIKEILLPTHKICKDLMPLNKPPKQIYLLYYSQKPLVWKN